MRADQAKTISVAKYLDSQGIKPKNSRKNGKELWYISPIRSDDKNPSFKVDTILNCWFDYGIKLGGNTLDLAIKMLNDSTVSEALKHLEDTKLSSSYNEQTPINFKTSRTKTETHSENEPFEVTDSKPLEHPALLQYLEKRGIDLEIAKKYLSEIVYKQPSSTSRYFGVGFPSGDGYEARNALFKGFVGTTKDVTVFENKKSDVLIVFEGFMDFLTYLTIKKMNEAPGTVIVLNSGNLRDRALPQLLDERFTDIQLFLDNDKMGDETVKAYRSAVEAGRLSDMREHYSNAGDLNEWHMSKNG